MVFGAFGIASRIRPLPAVTETANVTGTTQTAAPIPGATLATIDYIKTVNNTVTMSLNGEAFTATVTPDADGSFRAYVLTDSAGKGIRLLPAGAPGVFIINDARFLKYATISYASDGKTYYLLINTVKTQWAFKFEHNKLLYANNLSARQFR